MEAARFIVVPALVVVTVFLVTHAAAALLVWRYDPAGSSGLGWWRVEDPDTRESLGCMAWIVGMALFIAYHVASEPAWRVIWFPFAAGIAVLTAFCLFGHPAMRMAATVMIFVSLWPSHMLLASRPYLPTTSGPWNDIQIVVWTVMVTVWVGWVIARRTTGRLPSFLPALTVMAVMSALDVADVLAQRSLISAVIFPRLRPQAAGDGLQFPTHISAPFTYGADDSPAVLGDPGSRTFWLPDMGMRDLLLAGMLLMVVVVIARRLGRPSLVVGAVAGLAVGVVLSESAGEVVFKTAQPALPWLFGPMVLGLWLAAARGGVGRQVFSRRPRLVQDRQPTGHTGDDPAQQAAPPTPQPR